MCTRPRLVDIGYFNALNKGENRPSSYHNYKLCPCGMCIECRNMRREEYTQRLKHEIETQNYIASFITLTYRDDELPLLFPLGSAVVGSYFGSCPPPYGSTLSKSDAKNFCDKLSKRIKRKYPDKHIKYICAGEYGDGVGHRPHLHLIIVGLPAYERKMVYECWNKGRIDIEPVGNGAIRYVLSYIDKQVFGANELYEIYGDFQPPFCLFSKGIGKDWIEKNFYKFNKYGVIKFPSGKSYTLTPYYRRKYDFSTKPYTTPYSDSIMKWAKQRGINPYEAYKQRCRLKEIEFQRHQVKQREPLHIASKHIIHKELNDFSNKHNIDDYFLQQFTKKYLKRDYELVDFNADFLNDLYPNTNTKNYFEHKKNFDL